MSGKRHHKSPPFYGPKQSGGVRAVGTSVEPSPLSIEIVKLDEEKGLLGLKLNMWALPSPTLEYQADSCSFEILSGAPTIHFYQVAPGGGRFLNAIALSFTRMAFGRTNDSLQAMKDTILKGIVQEYLSDSITSMRADANDRSITHENFRKFSVQFVRAVCAPDAAFIDFYDLPPFIEQQGVTPKTVEASIQARIRVYLTPALFLHLLRIIDVKEGIHDGQ